jgi:hypothetical protein
LFESVHECVELSVRVLVLFDSFIELSVSVEELFESFMELSVFPDWFVLDAEEPPPFISVSLLPEAVVDAVAPVVVDEAPVSASAVVARAALRTSAEAEARNLKVMELSREAERRLALRISNPKHHRWVQHKCVTK